MPNDPYRNIKCPLSLQIMAEPVFASDGSTYEKEMLEMLFSDANDKGLEATSPFTREVLDKKIIVSNKDKRSQIAEILEKNPVLKKELYLPASWKKTLRKAFVNNEKDVVKLYLSKHPELVTTDLKNDFTALHLACFHSSYEIIECLVQYMQNQLGKAETKAAFLQGTKKLRSPLYLAAIMNTETTIIEKLVSLIGFSPDDINPTAFEDKYDKSVKDNLAAVLLIAIKENDENLLRIAYKMGGDLDYQIDILSITNDDEDNESSNNIILKTKTETFLNENEKNYVKFIDRFHLGSNIRYIKGSLLFWAIKYNHINMVKLLLDLGAKQQKVLKCYEPFVSGYESPDADVNKLDASAVAALCGDNVTLNFFLEQASGNPVVAKDNSTLLHWIIRRRDLHAISTITKTLQRTQIDAKNEWGFTPLFIEIEYLIKSKEVGETSVIDLLIRNGADVNLCINEYQNALVFASKKGRIDIVKFLLKNNISVDARDSYHYPRTALMRAAEKGHELVVLKLLKYGANQKLTTFVGYNKDKREVDVAGLAEHWGKKEIAKLIREESERRKLRQRQMPLLLWQQRKNQAFLKRRLQCIIEKQQEEITSLKEIVNTLQNRLAVLEEKNEKSDDSNNSLHSVDNKHALTF